MIKKLIAALFLIILMNCTDNTSYKINYTNNMKTIYNKGNLLNEKETIPLSLKFKIENNNSLNKKIFLSNLTDFVVDTIGNIYILDKKNLKY